MPYLRHLERETCTRRQQLLFQNLISSKSLSTDLFQLRYYSFDEYASLDLSADRTTRQTRKPKTERVLSHQSKSAISRGFCSSSTIHTVQARFARKYVARRSQRTMARIVARRWLGFVLWTVGSTTKTHGLLIPAARSPTAPYSRCGFPSARGISHNRPSKGRAYCLPYRPGQGSASIH